MISRLTITGVALLALVAAAPAHPALAQQATPATPALNATGSVAVGAAPVAVAADSALHQAYVVNRDSGSVSVINGLNRNVTATISVGAKPAAVAVYLDPNNHNFIYLRWQRGIMQYDASCTCTRGILLADYLKAILTGQNLPADVGSEAAGSPFLDQYDPGQPNWVHDPARLPDTNLMNAFSQG